MEGSRPLAGTVINGIDPVSSGLVGKAGTALPALADATARSNSFCRLVQTIRLIRFAGTAICRATSVGGTPSSLNCLFRTSPRDTRLGLGEHRNRPLDRRRNAFYGRKSTVQGVDIRRMHYTPPQPHSF